MRIFTSPISTSIGAAISAFNRKSPRDATAGRSASTTARTNSSPPDPAEAASASRNRRRQPNSCCGDKPCRRATAQTESPLDAISPTIRTFSSSSQMRRRPAPVNTSIRCAGLVLASLSVTILNLTAQVSPQALRSRPHSEGDAGTPLTTIRKAICQDRGSIPQPCLHKPASPTLQSDTAAGFVPADGDFFGG